MRLNRASHTIPTVRPRANRGGHVLTPDEAIETARLMLPGTPRRWSKLGPKQVAEIDKRLKADSDETMTEIARSFGVSVGRVSQINDAGILRAQREIALLDLYDELCEEVASGKIDADYACELMLLVAWKPRGFLRMRGFMRTLDGE